MVKPINSEQQERLGTVLRAAREHAHLTQVQLAKRLGTYRGYVSKYETGDRRLDVIEFLAVADALGVPPGKLLAKVRG
jgi:transcriptional regulator with XRE-family HTH domain